MLKDTEKIMFLHDVLYCVSAIKILYMKFPRGGMWFRQIWIVVDKSRNRRGRKEKGNKEKENWEKKTTFEAKQKRI